MSDKIKCKIEFGASSEEEAREIYDSICVGNELHLEWISFVGNSDFYCDAISRVEYEDEEGKKSFWKFDLCFRYCDVRYNEHISCEIGELELLEDKAAFTFQAIGSAPCYVVEAFADRFKVPFTLKHIDKTGDSWGIETFELDEKERFRRTSMRDSMEEDLIGLHLELVGYEPDFEMILRKLGPDFEILLSKFGPDLEDLLRSLDPESEILLRKFGIR